MKRYHIATLAALLLIAYAMTGCADYPLTGSISYRDPDSGAKGGLVFIPGQKPAVSVKVPYYDEQGNLIGMLDVGAAPKPVVTPEK